MRSKLRWLPVAGFALVLLVPLLLAVFGGSALADSPSPAAGGGSAQPGSAQPGSAQPSAQGSTQSGQASGALPGDPTKGMQIYQEKCTSCHGANLEGGVGAKLNPIDGGQKNLAPDYLIGVITNGKRGEIGQMPAWQGQIDPQGIKDVASYIINENKTKGGTLSPAELAKSNVLWVTIGILGMIAITYLLARYNMRWVGRRAAQRK